jgi:actin-related protein 4
MNRDSCVEDWDAGARMWENMLVNRLQPDRVHLLANRSASTNGKKKEEEGGAGGDADGDVAMGDDAAAAGPPADELEKALSDSPVLMTEAPWNSGKAREKAIEIAMEQWGVPAFWLSRTPVLAAFAAGKASALVVDVGGANASVTAIHDGLILKRSVQRSPAAGIWLSSQIREMWAAAEPRVDIVPTYMIENKNAVDAGAPAQARLRTFGFEVDPSFRALEEERVLTEFKESVVEVWRGPGRFMGQNEEYAKREVGRVFEMPDGANQMWREQRFRVAEGMWDEAAAYGDGGDAAVSKAQTIPELVRAALNGVDVDLRPALLGSVVVTGSTSLLNGFNDRLNAELTAMFPGMKIKIQAAGLSSERRFGAWIGGSILASLGTFHQMWISRKEYEENGPGIVEKRCK